MTRTICIDVGQTGIRLRDGDGPDLRRPLGARHLAIPGSPARLAGRVASLVRERAGDTALDQLLIGTTGWDAEGAEALLDELGARLSFTRAVVAGDLVVAHLTAHGLVPGVTLIAGTGLVALSSPFSAPPRVLGGTGWLLGDVGGGYWIGAQGLRSALGSSEGRRGSARLRHAAETHFGDLGGCVAALYREDSPVLRVASFAPAVAEAALSGETSAQTIWSEAVAESADLVLAAVRHLRQHSADEHETTLPVAVLGGVSAQDALFREPLRQVLAEQWIDVRFCDRSPLDGCLLLRDPRCEEVFAGHLAVRAGQPSPPDSREDPAPSDKERR